MARLGGGTWTAKIRQGHWYLDLWHELVDMDVFATKVQDFKARNGRVKRTGDTHVMGADPGARTMLTVYSSMGHTLEFGTGPDRERLQTGRT